MAALRLDLPDDLSARLHARAAESRYATVEQYAQAILQASADDEYVDDDVEALLIKRIDSGQSVEFTPEFREQFRQQVTQRRQSRGK